MRSARDEPQGRRTERNVVSIFGAVSHAVRGAVRTGERVVGARDDAGDQQQAQGVAQEAAQHQEWANATPEQRAEQARAAAYAAGPTYLEKWAAVQPSAYSLGGDPNQANAYAAQAQATGQQHAQYLDQAAAQSQGVGYTFGQNLSDVGNAAQQYGQDVGGALMGYGQQQAYAQQQMGQDFLAQGQSAGDRSVGQPRFGAMNQSLDAADPNFKYQNQALGRATQEGRALSQIESQEGPSAAQAQLQSGLNQSQASNLALARSGRGWGGGAGAMAQAQGLNAAAGQNTANQAAALRAQENAAYRQRAAANLGAAAGINLGAGNQFGQQQQQEVQAALGRAGMQLNQQGLASSAALQQQSQNDAYQQGMYNLGLNAQQGATQAGMAGLMQGATIGQQGYGQNLEAQQAGGQMSLAGLGQSGELSQAAGTMDLAAQQQAMAAQQQQVANNIAYENQMTSLHQGNQQMEMNNANNNAAASENAKQRTVQYVGAGLNAIGSAVGALSDRDKKKDIEPANQTMLIPATDASGNGGPGGYNFGTGISGPNQAMGLASDQAANAASTQSPQSSDLKPSRDYLGATMGGVQNVGASLMGGGGGFQPRRAPMIQPQATAIPQPNYPTLSDKNEKTGYAMSDEDAKEAIEETPGYSFQYKDPSATGATDGRQFGIMAQDLEKTPAGRSVVKKQPDGTRMVDTSRLTMVNTAAMNAMQKQIAELEALVKRGKGKAA